MSSHPSGSGSRSSTEATNCPAASKWPKRMALTRMIERRLQLQEAKVRNVDVGDQEVKLALKQLIQQGEKLDEKDPASMKSVRDQLTLLKVVDREVRSGVMVADPEMKRYYPGAPRPVRASGGVHAEPDFPQSPHVR